MNISHHHGVGNRAKLSADHGSNQSKHLQPDYFLPSSSNAHYYSRKYSSNLSLNLKSKSSKIVKVASVIMLSLSFLATAVKVDASPSLNFGSTSSYVPQSPSQQPKKKPLVSRAAHKVAKRLGFSGGTPNSEVNTSTNLQTAASRNYKQHEITLEELYANEYGETMETTESRDDNGLAETLKRTLALRERALEARREDSRTESPFEAQTLEDKAISEHTVSPLDSTALDDQLSPDEHYSSTSTSSYEYDTDADIRTYENIPIHPKKKKLKTRRQRRDASRYSERDIDQGLASFQSDTDFSDEWSDASSISDTDGYDTVYTSSGSRHSDDSSDEEDVPLPPPPTEDELAALDTHVELDNTAEPTELSTHLKVSNPDEVEYAKATDILDASDKPSQVAHQEMTKEVSVVADIKDITEEIQDESTTASVLEIIDEAEEEDSLPKSISANLSNTTIIEPQEQSTVKNEEELLKKASTIVSSSTQARQASKIAIHHIKQRMFERNMLVAVAAGDESESDQSQILGYSVWSSGAFGSAKQKASNNSHGYSSKILGGSIGADVKYENELLLGASFSKIRSNIKHASQKVTKKLNTYIASIYGTSPIKENLTLGVIGSAGFSPKPRSKLLSLESHLNYQIELPQDIKLLPNIGFKYEYERSKTHQEQIDSNVSIAHARKSYQAINFEIGSRVIFAPIKLDANGTSNITLSKTIASTILVTPTAHFSVERRISGRGGSSPYRLTYQGNGGVGQEIGASTLSINPQHQKTSFNIGIGLIASHKNIKLELLYDHTRQKRFKSHQGVLKLKVTL